MEPIWNLQGVVNMDESLSLAEEFDLSEEAGFFIWLDLIGEPGFTGPAYLSGNLEESSLGGNFEESSLLGESSLTVSLQGGRH